MKKKNNSKRKIKYLPKPCYLFQLTLQMMLNLLDTLALILELLKKELLLGRGLNLIAQKRNPIQQQLQLTALLPGGCSGPWS